MLREFVRRCERPLRKCRFGVSSKPYPAFVAKRLAAQCDGELMRQRVRRVPGYSLPLRVRSRIHAAGSVLHPIVAVHAKSQLTGWLENRHHVEDVALAMVVVR